MHRIRSLLAALAAGDHRRHRGRSRHAGRLQTAVSTPHVRPPGSRFRLGVGASAPEVNAPNTSPDTAGAPPQGTHGADVSAAAKSPTPDGFANQGAFVSSIAKGWGEKTSDAHQNANATSHTPTAAAQGLAHRPWSSAKPREVPIDPAATGGVNPFLRVRRRSPGSCGIRWRRSGQGRGAPRSVVRRCRPWHELAADGSRWPPAS